MSAEPAPLALAHRGFSPDGHENTLRAFRAAVELGFVWLETDVNTTADGVVVALHDATLDRVSDVSGRINELRWAQLAHVRVGGSEPLVTLETVLRTFPRACVNIDVKDEASVRALPAVLVAADAVHRVRVTSFSESRRRRTLAGIELLTGARVRTSGSSLGSVGFGVTTRVARVTDRFSPRIAEGLWRTLTAAWSRWIAPFDTVQLPVRHRVRLPLGLGFTMNVITPDLVAFASRVGIEVHAWTINETAAMRELIGWGVRGIVTDRADRLAQLLRERGQWPPAAPAAQ